MPCVHNISQVDKIFIFLDKKNNMNNRSKNGTKSIGLFIHIHTNSERNIYLDRQLMILKVYSVTSTSDGRKVIRADTKRC